MARTFKRQPAVRMLAEEITRTNIKLERADEQYAPQLFLTPSGAEVSRIVFAGVVTEKEDISGGEMPFWRLRVTDATGGVYVYAGQYQQETANTIAHLKTPAHVVVVGKLSLYIPENSENTITSIRPETVVVVDSHTTEFGMLDAVRHTAYRIKRVRDNAELFNKIKEKYPNLKMEELVSIPQTAVGLLTQQEAEQPKAPMLEEKPERAQETQPVHSTDPKPAATTKPDQNKHQAQIAIDGSITYIKEVIYSIIKQSKDGLPRERLPELLKQTGVNPLTVDWGSGIKRLENEGRCYETEGRLIPI